MRIQILVLSLIVAGINSAAVQQYDSNFVGEGTNDLATLILQGFVGEESNFVCSPIGYSTILAILSEGARGETHNQLVSILHLPEDTYAVRNTYKSILEGLKEKWSLNKPQFKNWFYVYKNYTVDPSYKDIIVTNYLTEVKSVDRVYTDMSFDLDDSTEIKPEVSEGNIEEVDSKGKVVNNSDHNDKISEEKTVAEGRANNKEIASILSANRIVGRNESGLDRNSKMIIFNGLFFRGSWETPFTITNETELKSFYKSKDDKISVKMMHTQGTFHVGEIPDLDCQAIELPYQEGQYSLLVLLPNSRDGLPKLISDMTGYSLNKIYKDLESRPTEVYLPTFNFQTISDPRKILEKFGVTDIFSEKADLSGITSEALKLGDLVQMVTLQVDEGSSQTNFLTASDELRAEYETFKADHPFLFFIRDRTNNVIIVTGKVLDPTDTKDFFRR